MISKQKIKGFTLIELLIAVAIIALVGSMGLRALPTYVARHKKAAFRNAVESVFLTIKDVRGYAISSKISKKPNTSGELVVPSGGYGLHIDKTSKTFKIFVDDWNKSWNSGAGAAVDPTISPPIAADKIFTSGQDTEIKSFELLAGARIDDIIGDATSKDFFHIIFKPPMAEVVLSDETGAEFKNFTLKLRSSEGTFTHDIFLNKISGFPLIK